MKQRHEVLFTQLSTYREETLSVVEGITETQADIIPQGFNNNIRWNLGHLFLDQYLWIQAVTRGKTEVPGAFNEWFGFGTNPDNFTKDTPSFEELKQLLSSQPDRILKNYGNRLEETFEPTEMGIHTIEQALIRTIFHEGLHLAAIQYLKRFI